MYKDQLRKTCFAYEDENGGENFLEVMADIVSEIAARHGMAPGFKMKVECT